MAARKDGDQLAVLALPLLAIEVKGAGGSADRLIPINQPGSRRSSDAGEISQSVNDLRCLSDRSKRLYPALESAKIGAIRNQRPENFRNPRTDHPTVLPFVGVESTFPFSWAGRLTMHKSESLARLVNSYRYKVITGEKHIDPEAMVRNPCRHCQECAGQGCPHVMRDLPAFENWIRVDRFVSKYLNDIANLAAKGLSPDMHRSRELALANEMIDSEILDECVNAAAETEFRLFRLIPAAIAECKAVRANPKASTPARDELLLDIYRWLRPKLSLQLASNEGTLKGNVPTASVLDAWTVHFLERLELFNTEFRIQRDSALPIPSDQLVGNFLNYVSAHAQYEKLEKRRLAKRNSAQSIHSDNGQLEVADDRILSPEEVERIFQIDSLGAAIQRLPEPHRQAIEMQLAGHKLAEIAGSLGKSVGQVKNTLRSARNMLHEWMPTDD